uniref:Uncharacterized protein n=1 Tax=Trichinella nativa TaxID=6335 RepID=A0A0V1KHB4_9BILA
MCNPFTKKAGELKSKQGAVVRLGLQQKTGNFDGDCIESVDCF